MAGIPGLKKTKFYETKWFAESIAIIPPIVTAIITIWGNFLDGHEDPNKIKFAWILTIGIIWLLCASIIKVFQAFKQDKEKEQIQEYEGLSGAIHVMYGCISTRLSFNSSDDGRLRITIHRVVDGSKKDNNAPQELEQLLPYIGGKGGSAGRRFSIRSGIIGKAVREKNPRVFSRINDDYEAFIRELISEWSYTEDDARKLTSTCKSWMAVPIFGKKNSVIGVVYLDSYEKDFFTQEVTDLVISTCSGIALFINDKYT